MMISIWSDSCDIKKFPKLTKNINTNVLIIGGGITGILCAYNLKQKGIEYTLIEGDRIGSGVTKNTTAKISANHNLIYSKLIKNSGETIAKKYLNANIWAIEQYKKLSTIYDFDFEEKPSIVYSQESKHEILKEVIALNKLGVKAKFLENLDTIPIKIKGALKVENSAQMNVVKFLKCICEELNIYENTLVTKIHKNTVYTESAKITANKIIIATHFPIINKFGLYFMKMYQHRSYVIALDNAQDIDGMYVDNAKKGMSFRNYKNYLLIGGGDHRTGKEGGSYNELYNFAKTNYPHCNVKYSWATQDCITLDEVPYIGKYSHISKDIFVATGYNKWGMTTAYIASQILSNMITSEKTDFEDVFKTNRSILKPQLLLNTFETLLNFVTPSVKRCSHLGCALKWNASEKTWDCPCHGSRFSKNGKLLDNPATRDAKTLRKE